MWRPSSLLARRAFSNRTRATARSYSTVFCHQVPRSETQAVCIQCIESTSHFLHFSNRVSRISYFYQYPRFFSSNPSQDVEDLQSGSVVSEEVIIQPSDDADSSSNVVNDENGSAVLSEFESGNVVFEENEANLNLNESFVTESDGGSVAIDEKVGSFEGNGKVEENEPGKVESLLSLLQSSGGIQNVSLESSLDGMGLALYEDFLLNVLETPYVPGENFIDFFKWVMKKEEFSLTTRVLEKLVHVISEENRKTTAYTLWDLVKDVRDKRKGVVSTESLNGLIALFSRLGKGKAAYEVFNKFAEFECVMNADSYYFTIVALCKRSFTDWAVSVCENMLSAEKFPDKEKVGEVIFLLCKGGKPKDAHLVYLYAKDKKIDPPRSSINFLVRALCQITRSDKGVTLDTIKKIDRENISLALEMLKDCYSGEDRKYAIKQFSSVIKKFCWMQDVGGAQTLLLDMVDAGPPPGNGEFNAVINVLAKAGDVDEAVKMMELMKTRGLKPDIYAYTVIISCYVKRGAMEEACEIFKEAKKKHSKLTPVIYHSLIRGFCKLEEFDKAVNLLGEMQQHGVRPSHDEYNKLIKSLCLNALDLEAAEKLLDHMRDNGVVLNNRTRALISAVKELKEEAGLGSTVSA